MNPNNKALYSGYLCIFALGSCLATAQELESKLPRSEFDKELVGMYQHEAPYFLGSFKDLSSLSPRIRLFLANRSVSLSPALPPPLKYESHSAKATLFAVLPLDKMVVKLASVGDFAKLNLQIRSQDNALQLVRVLSDFDPGSDEIVRFDGMDMREIPENKGCIKVSQNPLQKAGITKPVVHTLLDKDNQQYFEVIRYMLPRYVSLGFGDSYTFDSVSRITEHVSMDGSYVMTSESVSTPGLTLGNQCLGG